MDHPFRNHGFRARQALADLQALMARHSGPAPVDGIFGTRAGGEGAAQALAAAIAAGGRLSAEAAPLLLPRLVALARGHRAAASPLSAAFAPSMALLLANRIAGGPGAEDLAGLWREERAAMFALSRHDRAALVQGHRTLALMQRRALF